MLSFIIQNSFWSGAERSSHNHRFRYSEGSGKAILHHGRFPPQLKGLFLMPKPLLQAGAWPEEVAHIVRAGPGHAGFGTQP